jgi:hypothetical protein
MRLTFHTNYAMHMLIHVATQPGHMRTVNDVAHACRFSRNRLVKVTQMLRDLGLVETARGAQWYERPRRDFHWPNACRWEGAHEALAAFLRFSINTRSPTSCRTEFRSARCSVPTPC